MAVVNTEPHNGESFPLCLLFWPNFG